MLTSEVLPVVWPAGNQTAKKTKADVIRNTVMPALKKLAPKSGAYINECDPTNPDWKQDYFGENYERLLQIKHKYDPKGVFWCKPCVGWDEWEIRDGPTDEPKLEWGVGQGRGRLCKRTDTGLSNWGLSELMNYLGQLGLPLRRA